MTPRPFSHDRFEELIDDINQFDGNAVKADGIRRFLLGAMKEGHPWYHMYRSDPARNLERNLIDGAAAFDMRENPLRGHHLRLIRRTLFRRYSFCKAVQVSGRLRGEETWFWLYKDLFLPRAALALLLGYALILGASSVQDAFRELAKAPCWPLAPPLAGLLLWSLVYLNARNQAGRIPEVGLRSLWVSAGIAAWAALYCVIAFFFFKWIGWNFLWREAITVSAAALPLSVLTQFFFGSERSLTDPL